MPSSRTKLLLLLPLLSLVVEDAPASAAPTTPTVAKPVMVAPKPFAKPAKTDKPRTFAKIGATTRLAAARKLIDPSITEGQLQAPTTLSVRQPYVDDHTYLNFSALEIYPQWKIASSLGAADWGNVLATFRSSPGRTYLVECAVWDAYDQLLHVQVVSVGAGKEPWDNDTFKLHSQSDVGVDKDHIFFSVPAIGLRDVYFSIHEPDNGWWNFESCKITPVTISP